MHIVLMGFRGSGKSTLGRMLADQLWRDMIDIDQKIRDRFDGRSVAEIWQAEGEPAYRAVEVQVLDEALASEPAAVIALGGGTPEQPDAERSLDTARDAGRAKCVYLACSVEQLQHRIASADEGLAQRPSLTGTGSAADEVAQVLARRDPIYRRLADEVLDVTHTTPEQALRHLVALC
jgi:shikimate kinase